jgi:hypothetical protein
MKELLIIKTNDARKIKSLLDEAKVDYEIILWETIVEKKTSQKSSKNLKKA